MLLHSRRRHIFYIRQPAGAVRVVPSNTSTQPFALQLFPQGKFIGTMLKRISSILARLSRQLKTTRSMTRSQSSTTLPPSPRELIANRVAYEMPLLGRKVNPETDTPLAALYRIYEHVILDQHLEMRNELEAFWYHTSWAVADLPDPRDPDPERYACLACITMLLCAAFNKRISLGLPRDAPAIFTEDMMDEWKAREPSFERGPEWAARVPPLKEELAIPHWDNTQRDFVPLDKRLEHGKASPEFASKNILIWQPHIHFL